MLQATYLGSAMVLAIVLKRLKHAAYARHVLAWRSNQYGGAAIAAVQVIEANKVEYELRAATIKGEYKDRTVITMRRVVAKLRHQYLNGLILGWSNSLLEHQLMLDRTRQGVSLLGQLMRQWRHVTSARGLVTWKSNIAREKALEGINARHSDSMIGALALARRRSAIDVMSLVLHRMKGRYIARVILGWQSNRATSLAEEAVETAELMRFQVERGAIQSEAKRLDMTTHLREITSKVREMALDKMRRVCAKLTDDAKALVLIQWRERYYDQMDTRVGAASRICTVLTLWQDMSKVVSLRLAVWRSRAFHGGVDGRLFVRNHTVARWAQWLYEWRGDVLVDAMLKWKTAVDDSRILGLHEKLSLAKEEAEVLLTRQILGNIGSQEKAVPVMDAFEEWRLISEAQKNAELQRGLLMSKLDWSWTMTAFKQQRAEQFVKPTLLVNVPAFLEDAAFAWNFLY